MSGVKVLCDEEVVLNCKDGEKEVTLCVVPSKCLISGFRVNTWDVLYRPTETGNLGRCGIPLMLPNFGSLKDDLFTECNTTLPSHGFGRRKEWTLESTTETGVVLSLQEDDETMKDYPFKFKFSVKVDIDAKNNQLNYVLSIQNKETEKVMPIQPGLHPYFTCACDQKTHITSEGLEGFDGTKFEWKTKQTCPNYNCKYEKTATVNMPQLGEIELINEDKKYTRMQIWSEPETAADKNFVCFEPITYAANGLNDKTTRLNLQPQETVQITCSIRATPF